MKNKFKNIQNPIFNLTFMNTLKSKMWIILTSVIFGISVILSIVASVINKNDSSSVTNPMMMIWLNIGIILVYISVFNIWFISKNFGSAKRNGLFNTEISSGISRKSIIINRLLVNKIFSVIPTLLMILVFFIAVYSSKNTVTSNIGLNTSVGLFALIVYDFLFTGIALFCSLSKTNILLGAIGASILIFTGLSPMWSLVSSSNLSNTYDTTDSWNYKTIYDVQEARKKYKYVDNMIKELEEANVPKINGAGISNTVVTEKITFGSDWESHLENKEIISSGEKADSFTNYQIYFDIRDKVNLNENNNNPILKYYNYGRLHETSYFNLLDNAYKATQNIINNNKKDYNNRDKVWSNSEYAASSKVKIDLSTTFSILNLTKEMRKTDFGKNNKIINNILNYMDSLSLAELSKTNFNEFDNSQEKDGWYYKDKNNGWLNEFYKNDNKYLTPGFWTFESILTMLVSNQLYEINYREYPNSDDVKTMTNKVRLLTYLVPFNTFTSTISNRYYDNNPFYEEALYSSSKSGVSLQREFYAINIEKLNSGNAAQIYRTNFNGNIAMLVYWIIGMTLIVGASLLIYKKMII